MNILDDLFDSLNFDAPVRTILTGRRWIVAGTRYCGLAASLGSSGVSELGPKDDATFWLKKNVRELADMARSANLVEASIGMAVINSLLAIDESCVEEINAFDVLISRGAGKKVAVVGRFHFIHRLRQSAKQLWVIEQHPAKDEYPSDAATELVPDADVIAISGSALINHTLDDLLALCSSKATVMVLGPSTPLSPILFDHGVTVFSGVQVVNEMAVFKTIGQSSSIRQVHGLKLVTVDFETFKRVYEKSGSYQLEHTANAGNVSHGFTG